MQMSARAWQSCIAATSVFALLAAGCGGAGGSGSGSGNDWYYHWRCNGDSQCLATNPAVPSQSSGIAGPISGGQVGCNQLIAFGNRFWGIPPATQCCDQTPTGTSCGNPTSAPTISGFAPASGAPNTTSVTISGTGFPTSASQVSVTINGIAAPVATSTSTQIVIGIPVMGSFKGPFHVTTSVGTAISSGSFSVLNPLFGATWAAAKGLFAVVGENGTILTSPDGIAWTPQVSGVNLAIQSGLHGITWSGTKFVAVGDNAYTVVSADGATWTIPAGSGASGITSLRSVVWSGSQFVRAGGASHISSSPDGLTWTARSVPSDFYRCVTSSGSMFVAAGYGILTSPDGATWTARGAQTTPHYGVTWSGTLFVTVGNGGTILTSPDGTNWTSRTSGTTSTLNGVAWSGNQFVAVGDAGTIVTSPDGVAWTARTSGTASALNGIAGSGTQFVAVGDAGTVVTSADGVAWTLRSAP